MLPPHVIITWMTDNVRAALKYMREIDEGFKKRSKRNRRNKTEGPKAKIGHNQGSISATMWATRLAKPLNRRPLAAELFVASHSRWTGIDIENGMMLIHRAYMTNTSN